MAMKSNSKKLNGSPALKKMAPYLMLVPAIVVIFIFKLFPMVSVIGESFMRDGEFTFRTYEILFGDRTFWQALWTTLKMNLV